MFIGSNFVFSSETDNSLNKTRMLLHFLESYNIGFFFRNVINHKLFTVLGLVIQGHTYSTILQNFGNFL